MTRPFFNKERVSDFEIFGRHADDAIRQLQARLREGHPVDVQVQSSLRSNDYCLLILAYRTLPRDSHWTPLPSSSLGRMFSPFQQVFPTPLPPLPPHP
jgi:hypothetical protein